MALWQDFKSFAFKGNLVDVAVAFVLGAAFSKVVTSLVENLIMPVVSYVMPTRAGWQGWYIGESTKPIRYGAFLGDLLNFFIIAAALFVVIVLVLGALKKMAFKQPAAAVTTRDCPYCLTAIPLKATRCPHCTSQLTA